ncbi:MAG: hypothetical protein ACLQNE_14445 [Thermoguttaceae bacterium]
MSRAPLAFSAAVEGILDDAVVRRLAQDMDVSIIAVHVCGGKRNLKQKVGAYNHAAALRPWVLLVDLDRGECAPKLRDAWLPAPAKLMCFRVAVREVEAWLLADRERIAQFLGVAAAKVSQRPDSLDDPKRTIVDLARHSRRKDVREDMVPRPKSGRSEGPSYASRLIEFTQKLWRPSMAAKHSDSLRRCREALRGITGAFHP